MTLLIFASLIEAEIKTTIKSLKSVLFVADSCSYLSMVVEKLHAYWDRTGLPRLK